MPPIPLPTFPRHPEELESTKLLSGGHFRH
jgi:hypothetical protein